MCSREIRPSSEGLLFEGCEDKTTELRFNLKALTRGIQKGSVPNRSTICPKALLSEGAQKGIRRPNETVVCVRRGC